LLTRLKKNRDYLFEEISKIEGLKPTLPEAALYTLVDYSQLKEKFVGNKIIENDFNICEYLLKNGVSVTPGEAFSLENSFRICVTPVILKN
jgi:aspartate/methionine/tyrosine aminotransferase